MAGNCRQKDLTQINTDRATYVSASLPQLARLLSQAASEGKCREVSKLLGNGASFHAFGPVGMNPLHFASMNGHLKVCKILLNAGVLIDSKNKVGKTALHLAAVNGHIHIVQQLLSLGASFDPSDMLDMTPLHWACDRGYISVVKLLLSYDADPSRPNKFQKTPLQLAIEKRHAEIVDLIQSKRKMGEVKPINESPAEGLSDVPFEDGSDSLSQTDSTSESDNFEDCEGPQIFSEELTPQVLKEEIVGSDDIEDITKQVQKDLLYEDSSSSPETMEMDEEIGVQDSLLKSLNKLQEVVSIKTSCHGELNMMHVTEAAELLRAQAALVSLEDPSRMLRRAIYYGQTIQLTEAGERALAMMKPDPFIIPSEEAKAETKDEENGTTSARSRHSSGSSECSAVVLRSKTIYDLVSELASRSSAGTIAEINGPSLKRYKIL